MSSTLKDITPAWTLFIDRDGVINDEKHLDYIHTWDEFLFYRGVKDAFKIFNNKFGRIILVTNQRGVAKGLTRLDDLEDIHARMLKEITESGGRIDRIYYCADMEGPNRKPAPGMGLQAMKDFPEIDPAKSIMIGNSVSDMRFGRNLGVALTVFLTTTHKDVPEDREDIDLVFNDLISVAESL